MILQRLYRYYFEKILPIAGRIISGHKIAYSYLPSSVINFPHGEAFKKLLEYSGFKNVSLKPLTLGIVTLYIGINLVGGERGLISYFDKKNTYEKLIEEEYILQDKIIQQKWHMFRKKLVLIGLCPFE